MARTDEMKAKNENLFERNTILLNENERLKKENEELETRCAELFLQNNEFAEHFTKAKELLQHFISMDLFQIAENDQDYNAIEQAEQFLKEIEK